VKWILFVVGALVLLAALLALIGAFLPREHSATCRARFRAGAEALFQRLADVEAYPAWHADVRAVRFLEPVGETRVFVEETKEGPRRYAIEACEPPRRLVLRVADDSLPYGGTWTYRVEPEASGCMVSVTEDGFVKPVIFRTLARFVFGYHATMESALRGLAQALGESVTIERS
jgi:uncharacterized protein YndB with AHSA1/START domain